MTWFLCPGRCAGLLQRRSQRLPALRGSNQRVATPDTYFRPPGRPCRKESQTVSLIPFRILWIASAVGCQSTHARLRSPRLLQGNQPPCLQKPLEPETAAGQPAPLRLQKLLEPETAQGNQPPRLQKFLDLFTEGNRPTRFYRTARDCCRATSPRVYKSSSKAGPLGTTSPTAIQISPFIEVKKLNYPSRHALRNQGTTPGSYEGNRPSSPHRSSSSAGG